MNNDIFNDCLAKWLVSDGYSQFWKDLAKKYGYSESEVLRNQFKKERKRRGITRENARSVKIYTPKKTETNCRILLWDIETSMINALVWGIWEQNVNIGAILQDWHLLSWSAKWLFEDEIMSDVLTPTEAKNHDDRRIVETIWKLLNQADIVVAHNGDRFDTKRLNTRFLVHGLPPVSHYRSIDTLTVAKNSFSFTSNKLDFINGALGIEQKTETGLELWMKAYFGDPESLTTLKNYNMNDVAILEELLIKLRPFIRNFPNLNLYSDENTSVCRNCGSEDITWSGYYYTNTNRYKGWRCNNCGAIGRDRKPDIDKDKRNSIVL